MRRCSISTKLSIVIPDTIHPFVSCFGRYQLISNKHEACFLKTQTQLQVLSSIQPFYLYILTQPEDGSRGAETCSCDYVFNKQVLCLQVTDKNKPDKTRSGIVII